MSTPDLMNRPRDARARMIVLTVMLALSVPAAATDIMETLTRYARLAPFVALIERAGLADQLRGEGPWTVFAPEMLPTGAKDMTREDAATLVRRHLVNERLNLFTLVGERPRESAAGHQLRFVDMTGDVLVDNRWILQGDITADNGVIHIIETSLTP